MTVKHLKLRGKEVTYKKNKDDLLWLDYWFAYQAKHHKNFNISIETLDNPGWAFFVELTGTKLEKKSFVTVDFTEEKDNWLFCRVQEKKFEGACGPRNLPQVLAIFRKWVEESEKSDFNDVQEPLQQDFSWFQDWYYSYCNGDWEHDWRVRIQTDSAPSWWVKIHCMDTDLEGKTFTPLTVREKDFWLDSFFQENVFTVNCSPKSLAQAFSIFRSWVEK